jgi:hypothetical protein
MPGKSLSARNDKGVYWRVQSSFAARSRLQSDFPRKENVGQFGLASLARFKKKTTTVEAGAGRQRRANGRARARVVRKLRLLMPRTASSASLIADRGNSPIGGC